MATAIRALVLAVILAACASTPRAGVAPVPREQVADRLYFGQAIPGGGMVPDTGWQAFLRDVITPAFPEGLTVWRAEGQWLDPRGELVKEPVIILEVIHPRGTPGDSVFERIATAYRVRFRQDAVMRTSAPVRLWMYARPN